MSEKFFWVNGTLRTLNLHFIWCNVTVLILITYNDRQNRKFSDHPPPPVCPDFQNQPLPRTSGFSANFKSINKTNLNSLSFYISVKELLY